MIPESHRAAITEMLDQRKWPIAWLDGEIAAGRIAVMSNDTACIGVEKRVYPGGFTELHGMFAAGDMSGVLELVDAATAIAQAKGFDSASISSTPAWGRILKSRGFAPSQLTIMKELAHGSV